VLDNLAEDADVFFGHLDSKRQRGIDLTETSVRSVAGALQAIRQGTQPAAVTRMAEHGWKISQVEA
jgi:hypothetical protein